jgi:hypothetical protein
MADEALPETESKNNVQSLDTALQKTVDLDSPIQRGNKKVTSVIVRKPTSGALRGVALTDIIRMEVQSLVKVLPRITDPSLTEAEVRDINPADLFQLGEVVTGFLLPKKYQES